MEESLGFMGAAAFTFDLNKVIISAVCMRTWLLVTEVILESMDC